MGKESLIYGTGSCPCPPHGLQLATLFMVSHKPFKGPYFFKASIPYCEHVGVYLHEGPSQGEIIHWYNFIIAMKGDANISFAVFIQTKCAE